jgi:DNA-binding transcriptional MerR regulator
MSNESLKTYSDEEDTVQAAAVETQTQKSKKAPSAFRTISEVADELDVQQHVLRFWETKFTQVKPLKRGGGRRYYRPEDVALLKHIHHLLYTEGYTIKGAQKLLKGQGKAQIVEKAQTPALSGAPKVQNQSPQAAVAPEEPKAKLSPGQRAALETMLGELKALRALVRVEG